MATTKQPRHRSPEVEKARKLMRQPFVDGREVLVLVKQLKAERAFGTARKLLDHALHLPVQPLDASLRELAQQLGYVWKDGDSVHGFKGLLGNPNNDLKYNDMSVRHDFSEYAIRRSKMAFWIRSGSPI